MIKKAKETIYFTYKLEEVSTGRWYYGVKFGKGSHPSQLLKTYYTSSKVVRELIQNNGVGSFRICKIKLFPTEKAACDWERKLLVRCNAHNNPKFINLSAGKAISSEACRRSQIGRKHSPERIDAHRRKLFQTNLRKRKEREFLDANRVFVRVFIPKKKPILSPEILAEKKRIVGEKISEAKKARKTNWWHCPKTFKNLAIPGGIQPPVGYIRGMYKASNGLLGFKVKDSTKQKISDARKGKPLSDEHREKLSQSHQNQTWKCVDGRRIFSNTKKSKVDNPTIFGASDRHHDRTNA